MKKWGITIALLIAILASYQFEYNHRVYLAGPPAATLQSPAPEASDAPAPEPQAATAQAAAQKKKADLPLDVPIIQQMPELPRGCEVTSLAMLLNDAGVNVDKMTLAKQIAKVPFMNNGLHGDMNEGFVGDIYSFDNPGLGVYADPIFNLGKRYLPDKLVNLTGESMDDVLGWLDAGSPVWVITTSTFAPLDDDDFRTWKTENGSMNVTYSEHSVVLTGYDDKYVYINDPYETKPNKKLSRANFEKAWEQMGSQAISYRA